MAFKEQCGLPPVSTLKQCMQSLATRLQGPDASPGASLILKDGYPCLEPLTNLNDTTRKLLNAYDMVNNPHAQLFTEKNISLKDSKANRRFMPAFIDYIEAVS